MAFQRHPNLSIRKPEATSINRILGFNKAEVDRFFENLENVMTEYHFPPSHIYNVDETGVTTVQETEKNIAPKGQMLKKSSYLIFKMLANSCQYFQNNKRCLRTVTPTISNNFAQCTDPTISNNFAKVLSVVSPLPNISNKNKTLRKQHSVILSSTPMKTVFEEKEKKRLEKKCKTKTIAKKKGKTSKKAVHIPQEKEKTKGRNQQKRES
ncbi:hypothetical protein HF086_000364 [Spodoptera exigua]|uniref:Uncharacterized protein n=1 Tax=Spodoptera exigua TaxID=7107 RepID=A0A922SD61_SPOEX|nr:hypothetical protein HF086_000364 [Spodoptera exigua]